MEQELGRHRRRWRCGAVAAFALLIWGTQAHACSPVKAIGVYFGWNSAEVSGAQVARLASWMADLRLRYPHHEAIYVGASVEPGEHAASQLGMARAMSVAHVLRKSLAVDAAKIHLPDRSYVEAPAPEYLKRGDRSDGVRGVQLDFLPACPHECPCQFGDPLHETLRSR